MKPDQAIKSYANIHRPGPSPNVFLFSTPRSGSTWIMELIWSQPGFKYCNEPLNLQNAQVSRYLEIATWRELYSKEAEPKLYKYFHSFCTGRLRFKNPNPFRRYYRPITSRIVFKEIHGGAERLNWLRDTFNGRIVLLVRHPIAVTISRNAYQTLDAFLHSDYSHYFTQEEREFAQELNESGTKLQRGVLAWCLQNAVPLRTATDDWAVLSYEQLVIDPEPVIAHLAEKLELSKPERMKRRLAVPSGVKAKSSVETQRFLERKQFGRRSWLIEKWREDVDASDEAGAMSILERFDLNLYSAGEILPTDAVWIDT